VKVVAPSGGDYTSIKSAIDSISEGDKYLIKVKNGTYTESSTITINSTSGSATTSTIIIVGETEGKVFIQTANTYADGKDIDLIDINTNTEDKLFFGMRNITIQNCRYGLLANNIDTDGDGFANGSTNGRGKIFIYNCHFKNCGYDGSLATSKTFTEQAAQIVLGTNWSQGGAIRIHDFKGIMINSAIPSFENTGVEIAYCEVRYNCRGIRIADSNYVKVHNNNSHHNLDSGIFLTMESISGGGTVFAKIYNNKSKFNNNNGILLIASMHLEIYENDISNNWNSGIQSYYSFNVSIKDNNISYNNSRSYNGVGSEADAFGGIHLIGIDIYTNIEAHTSITTNSVSIIGNTIIGNQRGRLDRSIGINIKSNMDKLMEFYNLSGVLVKKPIYIYNNIVHDQELGINIESTSVPKDGSTHLYDINSNSLLSQQSFYIADTNLNSGQELSTNIRNSSSNNRLTTMGNVPINTNGTTNAEKLWFINTNTKQFLWVESPIDGKLSLFYGNITPIFTHDSL